MKLRGSVLVLLLVVGLAGCVRAGFGAGGAAGRWDGTAVGDADGPVQDGAVSDGTIPGTWASIPAGSFTMGSPSDEPCREPISPETPHLVTLTRGFEISVSEVTQGQFSQLMGHNPSGASSCGQDCPVENVTWYGAAAYCNTLSSLRNLAPCYSCSGIGPKVTCTIRPEYSGSAIYGCPGYRLPTEAEWEYAYRAGGKTALHNGAIGSCGSQDANADAIAWYSANSVGTSHPVMQKQPNAWGLHDMAGNVREWCQDGFKSSLGSESVVDPVLLWDNKCRIDRNGSFEDPPSHLRAAGARNCMFQDRSSVHLGFRWARTR